MNKDDIAFSMRLPKNLVNRLDALTELVGALPEFQTKVHIARSDVLRICIVHGITKLERKLKQQK